MNQNLATGVGIVRALEYIPEPDNLIVAGGEDQILRVWTLSPFSSTAANLLHGHQEAIWALEWVAEYSVLAAGSGDGTIRFWPISALLGDTETCAAGGLSDDGSCLGSEGQHVVSWQNAAMTSRAQVHSLVWASSISKLVSGWSDTRIRTWVYVDGTPAPLNPWRYSGFIQSEDRVFDLVWLATANLLGSASPDQRHPRLWDGLSNMTETSTYTYLTQELGVNDGFGDCPWAHCDAVLALAADATGDRVASGSMDNHVILWGVSSKNRVAKMTGHTDYVTSVAWLDSETKIASGSKDNSIKIWSTLDLNATEVETVPLETLTGHTGAVNALEWIYNDTGMIVSGGSDGAVKLWTCS